MITIEKAIETNEETIKDAPNWVPYPKIAAIKLGIEAMKQVQFYRSIPDGKHHNLLPGETKELPILRSP